MSDAPKPQWCQDRVNRLIRLRQDGFTASQIAADLGGITRSAVMGKLARLKIPAPEKKVVVKNPKSKTVPKTQAPYKPPLKAAGQAIAAPVVVQPLETKQRPVNLFKAGPRHCRYPLWGVQPIPVRSKLYCGAETLDGESYCAACKAIIYAPKKVPA